MFTNCNQSENSWEKSKCVFGLLLGRSAGRGRGGYGNQRAFRSEGRVGQGQFPPCSQAAPLLLQVSGSVASSLCSRPGLELGNPTAQDRDHKLF